MPGQEASWGRGRLPGDLAGFFPGGPGAQASGSGCPSGPARSCEDVHSLEGGWEEALMLLASVLKVTRDSSAGLSC